MPLIYTIQQILVHSQAVKLLRLRPCHLIHFHIVELDPQVIPTVPLPNPSMFFLMGKFSAACQSWHSGWQKKVLSNIMWQIWLTYFFLRKTEASTHQQIHFYFVTIWIFRQFSNHLLLTMDKLCVHHHNSKVNYIRHCNDFLTQLELMN